MNILLLGSGGREHALAWKIASSPLLDRLYIAPGNAGTASAGTNLPFAATDFASIKQSVVDLSIDLVVVGPEDPLVSGIHDFFLADPELKSVPVIGPVQRAAQLEGSKDFAKEFMVRHNIPTAAYRTFGPETLKEALSFLKGIKPPYVLKADGLAAGKGVVICSGLKEAEEEVTAMLRDAKFGKASAKVVIEEFLEGIELSVFVITDGKSYKLLPEAKDYKKIGEGDTGPNTGGMGSISPVPFATADFMRKTEERVIIPTVNGLKADGIDYKGFIFFGLMNVKGDPFVIEYNCRMGDPETESVIPRLKNDLVTLLKAVAEGTLADIELQFDSRTAATVMAVSQGYPGDYLKGFKVTVPELSGDSLVFHAGTVLRPETGETLTAGGRVLAVTSLAENREKALAMSYRRLAEIRFEGMNYRRDIGFDL